MNEVMWAVLSEWDGINTEVKAFCEWGMFMTSWETFMGCDYVKGGKEYLRLDECRLKITWGKLNHEQSSKQTKSFREGNCPLVSYGTFMK